MRRFMVLAASLVVVLAGVSASPMRSTQAATQGRWVVRDLGPCGSDCSSSLAINEKGQVVGQGARTAFLWQNGRVSNLGTLGGKWSEAFDINERGQVVGQADTKTKDPQEGEPEFHAFLWQKGKMHDLGVLTAGDESEAVAINEKGQVVGWSGAFWGNDNTERAVLWDNGKMRDLGTLRGEPESAAIAINNNGWVIGTSSPGTRGGGMEAVVWRDGATTGLGKLGAGSSEPTDINDRGQIVGSTGPYDGGAFLWESGKMRLIGKARHYETFAKLAIDNGGRVTGSTVGVPGRVFLWEKGKPRFIGPGYITAANERGQIVGSTSIDVNGKPVLWQNGKRTTLPLLPGHKAGFAVALNERNQIVGYSGNIASSPPGSTYEVLRGRIVLWTYKL